MRPLMSSDNINQISMGEIELLIFSVVGLVVIVHAIPQLFSLITYRKAADALADDPIIKIQALATFKSSLVYNILKIIIGAYLLCFSKQITGLITKYRNKDKSNLATTQGSRESRDP